MGPASIVGDTQEGTPRYAGANHQTQDASAGTSLERASDGGESVAELQSLGGRNSRRSSGVQDSEQARADADLEASILDTLTDSVLTGPALSYCSFTL